MAWYGLMRIHHPPWRFVSSCSRRTAPCSCLSPDFCPFPPLRFDALWRTVSFIPPEIPPLLGESISRLIHRRDKERVDKWKIFSFGGIFWEILFSGSRGLFISHNLNSWNSFREEREERLSIRRLEERFVVETTMLSSTDRRFVILCWGGYSEGISIDGWQLVAGLYISAINLALASPIEIRLLAIILSDLEVGARRWSFHNFLRRFSERPPFSSPLPPPLCAWNQSHCWIIG